jgi:hypothetical protein
VDAGWKPGLAGVHTYSRLNEWEVIDGGYTADAEDSLFCPPETDADLEVGFTKAERTTREI